MKHNLIIIGAGGHGKVVAEAAMHSFNVVGFADDHVHTGTEIIAGIKIIASGKEIDKIKSSATHFMVAVGNNEARKNIFDSMSAALKPAIIIHPSAVISSYSKIGNGTVVLANAVINADTQIGENCIINSHSLIDHDTIIGKHAHISQGAIIGSNCSISPMFTSELGQRIKSFSTL